jgi:LysR family transcriptional regulator, glycine cleavage system transcriptional activator
MQTKRSLPPLTALRAFEAAARHKSFKLAADELHVTPSAVSHAVAALEEFLGVKLFHRRVRRLLLTDAGGAYLAPLTRAFDAIGAATHEISARKRADLVTLASMPTFARVWLMPRLKTFLVAHPDVDLRVRAAVDFTEMMADDVDAAIAYGRGGWHDLVVDRLVEERMVPLCSPALRNGTPPLHAPADLARHTLIHTETKLVTWAMWLEAVGVEGADAHRGPRFNRADLALEAASTGLGVALDNPLFARSHLARGSLVVPFDPSVALHDLGGYYLVCRPEKTTLPKVEAFRRWIIAAAGMAEAGDESSRPAQQGGERSAP